MKKTLLIISIVILNLVQHLSINAQCTAVAITVQPQSQHDSVPGHAHFNISVTGTAPFNYYWYVNGTLTDSTISSASASNTYNTPPLTMADSNNTYYCIITNCAGANTITSNIVNLICIPVSIAIQPLSQTFTAGNNDTISFSVTVNGTPPFTYEWYLNGNLIKTTTDTIGHRSIYSFYAHPVVYGMNGNSYHVTISNHCGGIGNLLVSSNAVLTVNCNLPPPLAFSNNFSMNINCQNIVNLSTSNVPGATYNWTGPNGFSSTMQNPTDYASCFGPTCPNTYTLTISANGCTSAQAYTFINVYGQPEIVNPATNLTICSGATFSYAPIVDPLCCATNNYQSSSSGCVTGATAWGYGNISDVLINTGTTPCTVTYTVIPTLDACNGAPYIFAVTVNPAPQVTVNSPTICSGQTATLTASGATSYTWSAGATSTGVNTATVHPTITTTYTVTGTNGNGCTSTAVATVTVHATPAAPTATATENPSGNNCNTTILLNASYIAGGTYSWIGYSGFTASTQNTMDQITSMSSNFMLINFYVTVTVTGCTSGQGSVNAIIPPIPYFINPPTNLTICSGGTISYIPNLYPSSSNYGTTDSYIHSNSSCITGATNGNGNINDVLINNGTTPCIITYTVTPNLNGCLGTPATFTVTVNPSPHTTINSPTICSGQTATLTASGATSYTWSAGATSTGVNTATASPTLTTTYTVTGTNGCGSNSAIATVTVNPIPAAPTISVISGWQSRCGGGSINLGVASVAGATYSWYDFFGFFSSSQNVTVNVPATYPTQDYIFGTTVTVNGCTSAEGSIDIFVVQTPSITNPPPNQTICSGGTVTYIPNVTPGTVAQSSDSYTHSISSCITGATNGYGNINDVLINNGTIPCTIIYNITPYDLLGSCQGTSVSFTVTVLPSPIVTVNSPVICDGQTATLTANGATSYTWSSGATSIGTNTATASPTVTTAYTVIGTNTCGVDSAIATVTVNYLPTPPVIINGPAVICEGTTQTYSIPLVNGATSYTWSLPSLWSGSSTTNSITCMANGTSGNITVTANNTCGSSSAQTLSVNVNPTYTNNVSANICQGGTYTFPDGTMDSTNVIHTSHFSTINTCDSSIVTTLTVNPTYTSNVSASICQGSTYTFPDGTMDSTNIIHTSHFSIINTCDSSIVTTLTINPTYTNTISASICQGSIYTFPDGTMDSTVTVHTSHLSSIHTCDSSIVTTLTINPTYTTNISATICQGSTYTFPDGTMDSTAMVHTSHLSSIHSCDSSIVTTLTINPTYTTNISVSICQGSTYTFPDGTMDSTATVHTSHLSSINTCDSSIVTNLTVITPNVGITLFQVTCACPSWLQVDSVATSYQWVNCNTGYSIIPGETNNNYYVLQDGNYAVIVNQNGCIDTSACYYVLAEGVTNLNAATNIIIYPNPFTDQTTITFSEEQTNTIIKVVNVLGEIVYQSTINGKQSTIDIKGIAKGIYIVRIEDEKKNVVNRKIVVQ